MSLIFDSGRGAAASTHVLAIGVGRYNHLLGGEPGELAAMPLGLRQLSSPPVSLQALAQWFMAPCIDPQTTGFRNPTAPLGTFHALASAQPPISLASPNGPAVPDTATRKNIDAAFVSWRKYLQRNDENIGVFYFCGHGIMVNNHYLLAEDFGENSDQPWASAFDISTTIRAVGRQVKGALYFFLDACREYSKDVANSIGGVPSSLSTVDPSRSMSASSISCIFATGEGQLAFAPPGGQISRFTKVLIQALSGFAGIKTAGQRDWYVDGEELATAIRKLLHFEQQEHAGKLKTSLQSSNQDIQGQSVPLIRLASTPRVMAEVAYVPADRQALYELYLQSTSKRFSQSQIGLPLRVEVPKGYYTVGAVDPSGAFQADVRHDEEVFSPVYKVQLGTSS